MAGRPQKDRGTYGGGGLGNGATNGGALGMGAAQDRANARLSSPAGGLSPAQQREITTKDTGTGGMSKKLLELKYPGAAKKKNRQYDLTPGNIAKVGTIMGSLVGGPIGSVIGAGATAAEAIASGTNPLAGALDPFTGRGPDVPSTGAGYADSGIKDESRMTPAEIVAAKKAQIKKATTKLSPGYTLLAGAGGTLLGS